MTTTIKKISTLGNRLVNCNKNCPGICNKPRQGIILRYLYLEERQGQDKNYGYILVGINPGAGKRNNDERNCYKRKYDKNKKRIKYSDVFNIWKNPIDKNNNPIQKGQGSKHNYYKSLREFVDCLGNKRPILWTQIVKCESPQNKIPPLNTIRTCAFEYLLQELKIVPNNWKIIAVGKEPFNLLKYVIIDRPILGVPHPNSKNPKSNFHKLFKTNGNKRILLKKNRINTLFNGTTNSALWPD